MHELAFALLPIEKANSSIEAREAVYNFLSADRDFISLEGYDYDEEDPVPECDYFVVGGRFSGELNPQDMLDKHFEEIRKLKGGEGIPTVFTTEFIKANSKVLNKMWKKIGGSYESPLTRNSYIGYGYEDDAMVIDKEIAEKMNKRLIDEPDGSIAWDCSDDSRFYDRDNYKDLIDKAWVVVIDYHY